MRRTVQSLRSAGLHFYLKSLSLEVIFSSRLEMWYEALAMSVLLAVSLLLADCAECVCVFRLRLSLCPSVCECLRPSVCRSGCSGSGTRCVCGLLPVSLSTATVASRGAEFGLFEWSSRSLCRGAGLAGWTLRGRRSEWEQADFTRLTHCMYLYIYIFIFNLRPQQ